MSGEESLGSISGLHVLIPQWWAQEGVLQGWCWIFLGPTSPCHHIWSLSFILPSGSCFGCCSFPLCLEENDYLDSSWQTVDSYVDNEIYGMGSGQQWVAKPLVQKLDASMEDEDAKTSNHSVCRTLSNAMQCGAHKPVLHTVRSMKKCRTGVLSSKSLSSNEPRPTDEVTMHFSFSSTTLVFTYYFWIIINN